MIRTAAYIRVSTEEQRINGLSLETQKSALSEYAESHGLYITDFYVDAGLTARKKLNHRKDLLRLLDDVQKGEIDLIIFTKLDRWFRSISDYYKVQDILDKYKVNWRTIYEDYDTQTSNGRLHINIMLSIAQDEADRTSERIKVVFENKRERGETPAWKAPLGYKIVKSKLLINDDTKQMAIDVFDYYDTHHSIMGCVRMLKEKYDFKMYDYSIRRMLENKTYIGEFRGIVNFCEPLISHEQFYRIQNFTNVREFKNRLCEGRVYLFTSLLRCKECGRNLTSSYTRQPQKSGIKEFHYYLCKEYTFGTCTHRRKVNEDKLEQYLLEHIIPDLKDYILKLEQANKKTLPKYDVSKIRKRLEKIKDLYLDDLIDKDTYKSEYDTMQRQLHEASESQVKANLSEYKKIVTCDFNSLYSSFSREEKKTFWLGIIDHITVDRDNHYEIFFK